MNVSLTRAHRLALLVLVFAVTAILLALVPPIHQPQMYHHFADQRSYLGIPNFANVITNLPFFRIGLLGALFTLRRRECFLSAGQRWAYLTFFAGIFLTTFGSAYYHWHPDDHTLIWDRLPITVAFMGLLAAVIAERVSAAAGRSLLIPLVALGIASIFYWRLTADLRPYLFVQFFPILVLPLMLALFPAQYTRGYDFMIAIGWYALAKLFELLDRQIFQLGGYVSGHSLKHLAAGVSAYWVLRMLTLRQPVASFAPSEQVAAAALP